MFTFPVVVVYDGRGSSTLANHPVELDDTLCYCFHVSKRKVLNYIRVHQPRRASQVSLCGGAGTGCGWCVPFIKRYFEDMQRSGEVAADAITAGDYAWQRAGYVRSGRGTPPPGAVPLPQDDG